MNIENLRNYALHGPYANQKRLVKKTDLTMGYRPVHVDHTKNTLNDIFESLHKLMEVKLAKDEKLLLNSIDNLVKKSADFNEEKDFTTAYNVIDNLKDNITFPNAVTNAFIESYEDTLEANHEIFTADKTLTDMYYNVKSQLLNLNQQDSSSELPKILKSVETLQKEFRPDANASIVKMSDKVHQDILDAIWVADNLSKVDLDHDDPRWNIDLTNEYYSAAADMYRAGDFKSAKREMIKGGKYEIRKFWDEGGATHVNNINQFIFTQKNINSEMKLMSKDVKKGGLDDKNLDLVKNKSIFRHRAYVPKFGKHKLTQDKLDTEIREWRAYLQGILNDDGRYINFGEDDSYGRRLKESFYPDLAANNLDAGPVAVYNTLQKLMMEEDREFNKATPNDVRYPTTDYIGREDMIDWLSDKIQFVPDAVGLADVGWNTFGWNEAWKGSNRMGAEFFLDAILVGNYITSYQDEMPENTGSYGGVNFYTP